MEQKAPTNPIRNVCFIIYMSIAYKIIKSVVFIIFLIAMSLFQTDMNPVFKSVLTTTQSVVVVILGI